MKRASGFTLMETVLVIAITAIIAGGFAGVMVPMMNFYFYYPQSSRVNSAAADLMDIIIEGDEKAKGLRHVGFPCTIGGPGGGGSIITAASTSGDTQTLTYNYIDSDYCGSSAARTSHTVTLVYDRALGTVTRAIDGGAAENIPYYVGSNSDINFSVPGGGTDFFHYFNRFESDLGTTPLLSPITYVKDVGTAQSTTTGTTLAVTVPGAGVAQNNLIVVYFAEDGRNGTISATDTQGNTYAVAANAQTGSPSGFNVRTSILYGIANTALVSGNTITVTHPSTEARAVSVSEFSAVNTLGVIKTATGSGITPDTGDVTTTVADSVLIGAIGVEGVIGDTFTAGTGYSTAPPTRIATSGPSDATNITINPEYDIVSVAGAYDADGTITNRDWAAALATFFNSPIDRVDIEFIALQGSGQVKHSAGQIRLKSGVDIKTYST